MKLKCPRLGIDKIKCAYSRNRLLLKNQRDKLLICAVTCINPKALSCIKKTQAEEEFTVYDSIYMTFKTDKSVIL